MVFLGLRRGLENNRDGIEARNGVEVFGKK